MKFLNYINRYPLLDEANDNPPAGGDMSPEDISRRLSSPEGSFTEEDNQESETDRLVREAQAKADKTNQNQQQQNQNQNQNTFVPDSKWDMIKTANKDFKMPENLTAENQNDLLRNAVSETFGIKLPELHPLAKQIQELSQQNPNLSINDLISNTQSQFVDTSTMSTDDMIAFDLKVRYGEYDAEKNPDGMTDDDIVEHIKTMTKIQKTELGETIKERIAKYNEEMLNEYNSTRQKDFESQYDSIIDTNNKAIEALKPKLSSVDNIFGQKVSPEDHNAYLEEFKDFIKPDKTTGLRKIDEMLSDDVLLYKTFVLLAKMGEGKVIELITKGRESAKEDLMRKLKLTPTFTGQRRAENDNLTREDELRLLGMPELGNGQQ